MKLPSSLARIQAAKCLRPGYTWENSCFFAVLCPSAPVAMDGDMTKIQRQLSLNGGDGEIKQLSKYNLCLTHIPRYQGSTSLACERPVTLSQHSVSRH